MGPDVLPTPRSGYPEAEGRRPDSEPPAKGGHLVLAVGATEHCLLIHNPSGFPGTSQHDFPVPWDRLDHFYAGRGIVLAATRPTPGSA
ncbi:hypothetical protein ACQEVS_00315 [Streptomyces sp. CA-181903]|uniref:hypothetical protein n=1 Tax=Streptomyces sp. CA-181903 TaxID=3240055 RepID=UPI003D8F25EE